MVACPKCHCQVLETAKFCPECGNQLSKGSSDVAWIAAMQEKIKDARNATKWCLAGIFGFLVLSMVCFVTPSSIGLWAKLNNYKEPPNNDWTFFWFMGGILVVIAIICGLVLYQQSKKVDRLIDQLEKGQNR
jgi:hypothetical protein